MSNYINPRAKLLQHVDRISALKRGFQVSPVNVEIDLSNRCSLGCEWCHFGFTHTRGPLAGRREKPQGAISGGDLMDAQLAYTIIADLHVSGVRSITWTGGGEPTLHPHFDDIIRFAASVGIDQGMYTHGGHISNKRAALLKRNLQWVYVSLDCASREDYSREKGADRFEDACQGVLNLAHADGPATIGVGFLIHSENYHKVADMVALGLSLGADYVQLRPAVRFDVASPQQATEETAWIDEALPLLKEAAQDERVIVDFDRFTMYCNWNGHGYTRCYWAAMQTVITPDGSLWTCVNKREHSGAWLGNLGEASFSDIWSKHGGAKDVDGACRMLCRGHIPNLALDSIMHPMQHGNFI